MNNPDKKVSKFLSFILRHKPETIGLTLDENGWASVPELLQKLEASGSHMTLAKLQEIVTSNDKQRFIFSEDFSHIRANQGHSIHIDLQLEPLQPPAILYHGTARKNLDSIFEKGLMKQERHHVHLSDNTHTAKSVGSRYGFPVVLSIDAHKMYQDGFVFYRTNNNVWLTDHVPSQYLSNHA